MRRTCSISILSYCERPNLSASRRGSKKSIKGSIRRSRKRYVNFVLHNTTISTYKHPPFLLLCILEVVLISQTIQEFKEGKFNILVSTSIGEEGLDIGEVDFVVIYDMPKQSIKLVSYHLPYRGLS